MAIAQLTIHPGGGWCCPLYFGRPPHALYDITPPPASCWFQLSCSGVVQLQLCLEEHQVRFGICRRRRPPSLRWGFSLSASMKPSQLTSGFHCLTSCSSHLRQSKMCSDNTQHTPTHTADTPSRLKQPDGSCSTSPGTALYSLLSCYFLTVRGNPACTTCKIFILSCAAVVDPSCCIQNVLVVCKWKASCTAAG